MLRTVARRRSAAVPERSVWVRVVVNSHSAGGWSHGGFIQSNLKSLYEVWVTLGRRVSVRGRVYLH